MERIIVYGVGNLFQKYRKEIESIYQVVAYCDINVEKVKKIGQLISRENLAKEVMQYDFILVIPSDAYVIMRELSEKFNVPYEKMRTFIPKCDKGVYQNLPDILFHGKYMEDAVIFVLLQKIHVKPKDIQYIEIGLDNVIKGSATYNLYKLGARGVIFVNPYDTFNEEKSLYRSQDICIYNNFIKLSLPQLVMDNNYNLIVIHNLDIININIFKYADLMSKVRILFLSEATKKNVAILLNMGFHWYTTIKSRILIMYR
ncbi:hypothetical protein [Pectinatus frisingensis]|uniref:hypothetical protein n=1 Tax=Pectinatus frisingensis TaxID=865 RepID=UPI0018C54CCC|nr:hypothetical protein [Pectinatus frisingensis]